MSRLVFNFDLAFSIAVGKVTVGRYDGCHPCLTAATVNGKVVIHSPHRRWGTSGSTGRLLQPESNREIALLNPNCTITALVAGRLLPSEDKDVLVIGAIDHVLVYHVHDNKDVFYKEFEDGVLCIALGRFQGQSVLAVGGKSSVRALDHEGNELFWTATGGAVNCALLQDLDNDGAEELVVGCEDLTIRAYKGQSLMFEHSETDALTTLVDVGNGLFAYAVGNGTLGVYAAQGRLWRVKSKNTPASAACFDLVASGQPHLSTGWSNGKLDCRSLKTGEVICKEVINSPAAGVVVADYRATGRQDLIYVSTNGEVRGFCAKKTTDDHFSAEQEEVRELLNRKRILNLELRRFAQNARFNESSNAELLDPERYGVIPSNTRLQVIISTNENAERPHVEISVSTNSPQTIVRAVVVFAEGIFEGEAHVVHPAPGRASSNAYVPLVPSRDVPVDVHVKALVGAPGCTQYHVFEITRQLPRFAMYALSQETLQASSKAPTGLLSFRCEERLQRVCMWLNQNFLLGRDVETNGLDELRLRFTGLRDNSPLVMAFQPNGDADVACDSMALAADLVQSLASYLNWKQLSSKAHFVREEELLRKHMSDLADIDEARFRLSVDTAEKIAQIRDLVLRAEDSRINDTENMMQHYKDLQVLNKDLIAGHNIRLSNYSEGADALKTIHGIIQQASKLRVGKYSTNLLAACRNAIKNNNVDALIKIIRTGDAF